MSDEFEIDSGGVRLSGEQTGDGPAVVLLHGLTATRRYVVMGSTALQRGGHRVVAYDARAHGNSGAAADPTGYTYDALVDDLSAVLDACGIERAVLAGASMGAHTLLSFALRAPERVAGLVVITPAYAGEESFSAARLERWDALAAGLRARGVAGFLDAYGNPHVASERIARTILTVIRQRLSQHRDLGALADALQGIPRSRPFASVESLRALPAVPVVVVASSDDADPGHPQALGEAYAETIPGARLITDPPGSSPVAWQGSQLSKLIAEVVTEAA